MSTASISDETRAHLNHAFDQLVAAFYSAPAAGVQARGHARLLICLMGQFSWLNKQVSTEVLSRILDRSGYLPREESPRAA